jgi:hypothetical protein
MNVALGIPVGELKMAAPGDEKPICDKFNLEALTVNQVESFKALADRIVILG